MENSIGLKRVKPNPDASQDIYEVRIELIKQSVIFYPQPLENFFTYTGLNKQIISRSICWYLGLFDPLPETLDFKNENPENFINLDTMGINDPFKSASASSV